MRRNLVWILLGLCLVVKAQLHDAQWVIGPRTTPTQGAGVLDFRNDTVVNHVIPKLIPFFLTSACISDENGELLYISNGIDIRDKMGDVLLNGANLNPGPYTQSWSQIGLNIEQAALFLPQPRNSRYYYLLHFSNDTLNDTRPGTMYYSRIDKEGNFGSGEVVEKNVPILKNVILREGGMTGCKHANGRDYWVVIGAASVNKYFKFLITPDSIIGPMTQNIGPAISVNYDNSYSKFSQDGSKYAIGPLQGPIVIMDFNRCSGEFSNPRTISNMYDPVNIPNSGCESLEFSPSGRFLYVSSSKYLNQYDLWSGQIQDSTEVFKRDTNEVFKLNFLQISPNGKLYGSTYHGGGYFLHVVNKPNEKGDSCDFVYGGQPTLSDNSINLPNMINYKLGPLAGSGCDTLTDIRDQTPEVRQIRTQPNPADKYLYVEMPQPAASGVYEMYLLNELGQVVQRRETKQVDIFDTEALPNGIYLLVVSPANHRSHAVTEKIVIQHG